MPVDDPIDAPLHAQKKVERLQADLGDAKDKVAQDAKAPVAPQQQSIPAPKAEASGDAGGKQGPSIDEPDQRPTPVGERITSLDDAEIDAKADGPVSYPGAQDERPPAAS